MHGTIPGGALRKLADIVGEADLFTSPEALEPYSHDETAELRHLPDAVARVTSADHVSRILSLAQEEGFPVTPRGAGQGLSGGAVPVDGGLVLSLERMNRILEIDEENLTATVEPGVITGALHAATEARGLFYPPDPASKDSCTMGGNVAEDAGGPRCLKYGVTRNYVCGLEAVLPSGERISLGGKLMKDVTGYNLIQLLTGSEGTLGVITQIMVRLIPLPSQRIDLLVPFRDYRAAAQSVSDIIKGRVVPAALEFMERDSLLAVEKLSGKEVPFRDAAAHLLITLDGEDRAALEEQYAKIGEMCLANNAIDVLVADNPQMRERLWGARTLVLEALKGLSPEHVLDIMDIVVPRSRLPEILVAIRQVAERQALHIINFGHSGDGNVHVNIIKDVPEDAWREKRPLAAEEIYRLTVSMGGSVTGEHGIGCVRRKCLGLAMQDASIQLMRGIKTIFDPRGILNPGKIFP